MGEGENPIHCVKVVKPPGIRSSLSLKVLGFQVVDNERSRFSP